MYDAIKFILPVICLIGIIYIIWLKNKYKHNGSTMSKENIIKYFQDNNITSLENGIKIKNLPKEIAKSNYLLMMVQDKTLIFKKGKYYLNK